MRASSHREVHIRYHVQLRTILRRTTTPVLIVEHRAYERARDMAGHVAQAMKQASREATILLYAPALDRHLEAMAELADRVFCFYDMQRELGLSQGRGISEEMASQTIPGSHEVALVAQTEAQGTNARRKPQAPGAGDSQGDPGLIGEIQN